MNTNGKTPNTKNSMILPDAPSCFSRLVIADQTEAEDR